MTNLPDIQLVVFALPDGRVVGESASRIDHTSTCIGAYHPGTDADYYKCLSVDAYIYMPKKLEVPMSTYEHLEWLRGAIQSGWVKIDSNFSFNIDEIFPVRLVSKNIIGKDDPSEQ